MNPSTSLKLFVAAGTVALAGAMTPAALAHGGASAHEHHERHQHRHASGAFGGPGMFSGSPEHTARRLDRLLAGVNATDAQRARVREIAQAAATDLRAQREAARSLREQSMQLFTQPLVDARAAEELRKQMLAQHDAASQRVLKAMLEVAEVLTPEQRQQLGERMKQRREMFERHRRERESLHAPRS